jgi:hypothetical protein
MDRPPIWKILVVVLALGTIVGCQGFSSGNSSQTTQDPTPGALLAQPTSVGFGNVQVGTSQTQADTLSNTGGSAITLTQAVVTGSGFSITGLNLPLTLSPGKSATFNIVFNPQAAGGVNGTLTITSDGTGSPLNITLAGTGLAAGNLTANPTSLIFSNVQVGTGQNQTETLTNTGSESLTITQASSSAAAFTVTGLNLPLTLAPSKAITFGVLFTPTGAGASNGILSITQSGSSTTLDVSLSGTAIAPATLSATPGSLNFTGGQAGTTQTQTVTIQNIGGVNATISQDSVAGTGFGISGLSTPSSLAPGQTTSLTVSFAPQSSGSFSGSAVISSNASNPNLTILLSGSSTGAAQGQLSVSPGTISFGNVTVGASGSQTGTLSATGASVVVSSVSFGSSEFALGGLTFPATIAAGQSVNFTVTFTPQSSGVASVSLSFFSNASNSPSSATVTGTGVAAPVYSVLLTWNASTSGDIAGYNVYRCTATAGTPSCTGSNGSYTKINTQLDVAPSYTDASVAAGQTYYYETTAVNSSNQESAPSTPVQAIIPAP